MDVDSTATWSHGERITSQRRRGSGRDSSSSARCFNLRLIDGLQRPLDYWKKNHMWYHWWYVGTWFVPEGKAAAEEILFYSDLRSKGSVDISPIRFITCDFVGRIVTDQATPTRPCRYPIGRLAPRPLSPVPVNKSTMIIKRENWPRFFW